MAPIASWESRSKRRSAFVQGRWELASRSRLAATTVRGVLSWCEASAEKRCMPDVERSRLASRVLNAERAEVSSRGARLTGAGAKSLAPAEDLDASSRVRRFREWRPQRIAGQTRNAASTTRSPGRSSRLKLSSRTLACRESRVCATETTTGDGWPGISIACCAMRTGRPRTVRLAKAGSSAPVAGRMGSSL
ncbi:hypothetical protein D3C86_1606850 [compost metagenome]